MTHKTPRWDVLYLGGGMYALRGLQTIGESADLVAQFNHTPTKDAPYPTRVRYEWWRAVPKRNDEFEYHDAEPRSRGAFPVTIASWEGKAEKDSQGS